MAINTAHGGYQKPIAKSEGVLYFTDFGDVDLSEVDGDTDLSALALKNVTVSTEGIRIPVSTSEGDQWVDLNGNVFDATDPVSTKTIEFEIMEVLKAEAAELWTHSSNITTHATDGTWTRITPGGNPTNKGFIIDTRIKNKGVRQVILEASFASGGESTISATEGATEPIVYNVLTEGERFTYDIT